MRRILLLTALIIITLIPTSCHKRNSKEEITVKVYEKWYQLRDGRPEPVESLKSRPVAAEPWTVQDRITDSVTLGDQLYMAVNGHGIASVKLPEDSPPVFYYFYDPVIFKFRTITTLLRYNDSILLHLYFNETLNTTTPDTLKIEGISLVKLVPQYENYRFIIPPFQKKHPDYESVTFLPVTNQYYYFEWKYTDKKETRFFYTAYNIKSGKEQYETRNNFLKEYRFKDIKETGIPQHLQAVFSASLDKLKTVKRDKSTIHFTVKSGDNTVIKRFSYNENTNPDEFNLVTVPVRITKNGISALLPGGILIDYKENSAKPVSFSLPVLPSGYKYTGFNILDSYFVFYWEQSSFIHVKASGFLIWKTEG
ncbi:MAG: hypothetical protein GXP33_07390 [Spirochaetes bacterium]|nr:hypothetical protein [Spirochaetota bacterium]